MPRVSITRTPALALTLALALATGAALAGEPRALRGAELRVVLGSADSSLVAGGRESPDAALALGTLSARERSGAFGFAAARHRILVTIEGGPAAPAFVRLSAQLATEDGRSRVRVAGLRLSGVPQVVAARLRVGAPTPFDLEIEVPASSPDGALHHAIEWIAETP